MWAVFNTFVDCRVWDICVRDRDRTDKHNRETDAQGHAVSSHFFA